MLQLFPEHQNGLDKHLINAIVHSHYQRMQSCRKFVAGCRKQWLQRKRFDSNTAPHTGVSGWRWPGVVAGAGFREDAGLEERSRNRQDSYVPVSWNIVLLLHFIVKLIMHPVKLFCCFSSRTQNTKLCTFSHLKGWSLCFPSLEHKDGRRRTPRTTCSPSPIRKTSTLTNNKQTQVSKEHLSGLLLAYCIKSAFVILILKLIL